MSNFVTISDEKIYTLKKGSKLGKYCKRVLSRRILQEQKERDGTFENERLKHYVDGTAKEKIKSSRFYTSASCAIRIYQLL